MNQCDYSENQLHSEYRFNLTNYIVCTFFSLFLKRVSKYYIMGTIIYSNFVVLVVSCFKFEFTGWQ